MQDFIGKKILLGLCGGIAAYKGAELIRELKRLGAEVQVVMTQSAQHFMTPMSLQALSGREVRTELFDAQAEKAMSHIELARWADYLLIAPASANMLAKMTHGIADDLLSTLYLVANIPVIVCPAMNHSMWHHPATRSNCEQLKQRGVFFIGPEVGEQACGEYGPGRIAEIPHIIDALRLLNVRDLLIGRRIVITAGPTREAIDPVRYISNHSSGRMGYALALAARIAGAEVTLISGPTTLVPPLDIHCCRVDSARQMHDETIKAMQPGTIFIGCAAVADYAVEQIASSKIKKTKHQQLQLELTRNPDILAEVASLKMASYLVGFAAETEDIVHYAKQKLKSKNLDMIIANQVGENLGFEKEDNQVIVITKHQELVLPLNNKTRLAGEIIAILAASLHNVAHLQRSI